MVFRNHEVSAMTEQPDGEELAAATAEEFELEVPEGELVKFAVDKYTAHGYEGIDDCLFAMLCDLAGLYANRTRTPGTSIPRHITLIDPETCDGGILQTVANNIAPERGFADAE
jgi:hypothetical protein